MCCACGRVLLTKSSMTLLRGDSSTSLRRLPSSTLSPFFRATSLSSQVPQSLTYSFYEVFGSYVYFVSSSWGGTTTLSQQLKKSCIVKRTSCSSLCLLG